MTAVEETRTSVDELYEYIGNKIAYHREKRHWTHSELGSLIGKNGPTIARWETCTATIPLHDVYLIADAFEVSVYELLPESVL